MEESLLIIWLSIILFNIETELFSINIPPWLSTIVTLFNVEFEMIINKKNKLVDKFFETHKLRLHPLDEIKSIFKSKFSVINVFKWMRFSEISKKDWFGLYILKKN